jgi:hypothetical protein
MNDQPLLFKKLHLILNRAFVESRNLALGQNCRQVSELADVFEIIPTLMADWDARHLDTIRSVLQDYQARYMESAYDYLSILDMDEREFQEVFRGS